MHVFGHSLIKTAAAAIAIGAAALASANAAVKATYNSGDVLISAIDIGSGILLGDLTGTFMVPGDSTYQFIISGSGTGLPTPSLDPGATILFEDTVDFDPIFSVAVTSFEFDLVEQTATFFFGPREPFVDEVLTEDDLFFAGGSIQILNIEGGVDANGTILGTSDAIITDGMEIIPVPAAALLFAPAVLLAARRRRAAQ